MLKWIRRAERQGLAKRRTVTAVAAGTIVLVVALVLGADWPVALTGSWGVAAVVIILVVWIRIWPMDAEQTKTNARAEDFSRQTSDLVVLISSVSSLGAIAYTVARAGNSHGATKGLLIALALAVVSLSWLTVHTLYLVRYGDQYYSDPIGGIEFNDDEPPDYRDFAYLALTIGMTFQVSDTTLKSKAMRQLAIRHALLSFLFVAVIGALTINTVGTLLQP
jgi:uncharacterized membrane protein